VSTLFALGCSEEEDSSDDEDEDEDEGVKDSYTYCLQYFSPIEKPSA